jgi:hypothetical protein
VTKIVRTPVPGWTGDVGHVHFTDGEAKVADNAQELAYFRSAGYEITDLEEAVEALEESEDSDDQEHAEQLQNPEQTPEQGGSDGDDPQIVADVDDDGVEEVLPRKNASAEEWRRFGVEHGLTHDEVDGMSRDDLVAHFVKEDDQ